MLGLTASFCFPDSKFPRVRFPIPLKSVEASIFVIDSTARVSIRQKYENSIAISRQSGDDRRIIIGPSTPASPPQTLECAYNFPIDPSAAVLGLKVTIGNTEIKTEVRAKDEARSAYEKATAAGLKTTLLEQDEPDVATIYVGNLAPKETAVVEMTYVTELATTEIEGVGLSATGRRALRFVLPTTIAPRYGAKLTEGRPAVDYSIVPEAVVDYRLFFDATIRMSLGIDSVVSPSHPNLTFAPKKDVPAAIPGGKTPLEVTVRGESIPLVKDLVIAVVPASEKPATSCVAWSDRFGELAVVNTFAPIVASTSISTRENAPDEFVLVFDRSGSMMGEKLQSAKDAASLFVTALPTKCKFSIVAFSDDAIAFSQVLMSPETEIVERAKKWIYELTADGGTHTHKGIKLADEILRGGNSSSPQQKSTSRRSIFAITDGEFFDRATCLAKIADALKAGARTYALGIGDAISRGSLQEMAQAGDGTYDTAMASESVVAKVMGMMRKMRGPIAENVRISVSPPSGWRVAFSTGMTTGGSVFSGTLGVLYSVVAPDVKGTKISEGAVAKMPIEISYSISDDPTKRVTFKGEPDLGRLMTEYRRAIATKPKDGWMSATTTVELVESQSERQHVGDQMNDGDRDSVTDGWVHALAARKREGDLLAAFESAEMGNREKLKVDIKELGLKYGIMTSETSFVGVGTTLPPSGKVAPPKKVLVPISIPTSETFFFGGGGGGGRAKSMSASSATSALESATPTAPIVPTREQTITLFLLKQNADGSWSPESDPELRKRVDAIVSSLPPPKGIRLDLWRTMIATAIVVWSFPTVYGDLVEVWRASTGKGREYLSTRADEWDVIAKYSRKNFDIFSTFEVTSQ